MLELVCALMRFQTSHSRSRQRWGGEHLQQLREAMAEEMKGRVVGR
jgi:hypothetical protein